MSESNIREQIVSIISGVSSIGNVYDYQRFVKDEATFRNLFLSSSELKVWMVKKIQGNEVPIALGYPAAAKVEHIYEIEGWVGLSDANASEKTLANLIEGISGVLRSNITLNGTCFLHHFCEVKQIGHQNLFGRLCNYTKLGLKVEEIV